MSNNLNKGKLKIVNTNDTLDVYVSGTMDDDTCLNISNSIKLGAKAGIETVKMHINSYGGSVAGCYDIVSSIKSNNLKLHSINEGFAISAASLLLAAADYAEGYSYSTSLIHDPLIGNTTLEDAKDSAREFLVAIKDGIMNILNKRLKLPIEELSNLLKKETSWNAKQQLDNGLIDNIIETSSTPKFNNNMDYMTIWNIIEEHNNLNSNITNMTQEEIDALIAENEALKAKIKELEQEEEIVVIPTEEIPTEPMSGDTVTEEVEMIDVTGCTTNVLQLELNNLKVENFILKNKLEEKSNMIENAVKLHGVEVLDTIINFINNDSKALETKVNDLQNVINNVVNEANKTIENVINNSLSVVDYELMAEEIFGIDGDSARRIELKHENPELHEKLFNIYYDIK